MLRIKRHILNIKNPNTGEYESVPIVAGESAYEIAVRNGYTGSEQEWMKDTYSMEERISSLENTVSKILNASTKDK